MCFVGIMIFHTLLFAAWMRVLKHFNLACFVNQIRWKERRKGEEGAIKFYNFLRSPKGPNEWRNIPFCHTLIIGKEFICASKRVYNQEEPPCEKKLHYILSNFYLFSGLYSCSYLYALFISTLFDIDKKTCGADDKFPL